MEPPTVIDIREVDINLYTECSDMILFAHRNTIEHPDDQKYHLNNMCEVYLGITDGVQCIVDGVRYDLKPGDIMIIPPFAVHRIVLADHDWYERFYFVIPLNAFPYMDHNPLETMLNKSSGAKLFLSLPVRQREQAIELLYKISSIVTERDRHFRLTAYSYFLQFIGLITAYLAETAEDPDGEPDTKLPKLIHDVLVYIDHHLTTIDSIDDIASHFHVSLRHLSKLFKEHLHIGIKHYMLMKKIAVAKRLLHEGNTVTYVCYESGFNDCSYFIKTFKQYAGMTPLKFQTSMPASRYYGTLNSADSDKAKSP
jgi:AraC-like DNA-binding protein